ACPDGIEPAFDRATLIERKDIGLVERHRPRLRELDIKGPKAKVDGDRVIQRVEVRRGAASKPASPQFVRCRGRECRRRHAICSVAFDGATSSTPSGIVTGGAASSIS